MGPYMTHRGKSVKNTIIQETNRRTVFLAYNHATGGPKRNPHGGVLSEFLALHSEEDKLQSFIT